MHFFLRVLREPLVHFLAIGFALFVAYSALGGNVPTESAHKRAEATIGETRQLIGQFRKTWSRAPSPEELDSLIAAKVREHILVQEALALSMDQGDAVIRQRLRQKMNFLIASAVGAEVPQEEDLLAFYKANSKRYIPAPRIRFQQVFLGDSIESKALNESLKALNAGANPVEFGRPILLPSDMPLSTQSAVDGTFGQGFFASMIELDQGSWQGPIRSGFGIHIVLVTEVEAKALPDFTTLREVVLKDYKQVRSKELAEEVFQEMQAKYEVVTPDAAARAELLK